MFSTDDTIVAIATPPGHGGIGVVRLSGPDARAIAARLITHTAALEPRHATFTLIRREQASDHIADHAVATLFTAPHSYTGEDVVELSVHGSPIVTKTIVVAAVRHGARLAEPGEFTLRAHLNGRLDLMQAEAVADLIASVTPLQARTAFDQLQGTLTQAIAAIDAPLFDLIARLEASVDFPEEAYHFAERANVAATLDGLIAAADALLQTGRRGRLIREGFQVAVVGPPNAGKSSLFNALVGAARAIVADVPGTTRDMVTEAIDLCGFRVTIADTAGLRASGDVVEAEGVERSRRAAESADLVLLVQDGSAPRPAEAALLPGECESRTLVVRSKSDLAQVWASPDSVSVSVRTGDGLDSLRQRILAALDIDRLTDRPEITNVRHIALLQHAREALVRAREAVGDDNGLPEEFVLADLQDARAALEEITGKRTPEDVLAHIFARFCIGK